MTTANLRRVVGIAAWVLAAACGVAHSRSGATRATSATAAPVTSSPAPASAAAPATAPAATPSTENAPARDARPSTAARVEKVFGDSYSLEASVSVAAGLFHWVDSLAGTSGGKTIPQYREEYYRTFGGLTDADKAALRAFREVRLRNARRNGLNSGDRGAPPMLGTFLEAADLDSALRGLGSMLPAPEVESVRGALDHFEARYRQLWRDGAVPNAFVEQAGTEPARAEIEALLARVAKFFGVDPKSGPTPRIVLVPVPSGGGTHAEAVGPNLLIEIRDGERLVDEIPPIVHENSHFLWYRMPQARNDRLRERALEITGNDDAWRLLHEALPTALGQGVAARRFLRGGWSVNAGWYHVEDIDRFAKEIYPAVQKSLDEGGAFDEAWLGRILKPPKRR